ncbi:MAG: hypothetical protein GY794_15275, partial [bacterium]|nr:hypothetical protein [bacterium]
IRKVLELSPFLSKNDPLAALIFSPLREQIPLHPLEISLEDTLRADMKLAFARFDRYFDPLYAFHLNSERRLKRWLFTSLGHLILLERSANLDNIERMQAESRSHSMGGFIGGQG